MEKLQMVRDALGAVAMVLGFVGAVLMLVLVDAGLTLLLIRWTHKVKKALELPQPQSPPMPALPDDHKVTIIGGGVRKWE
jgi:hypothetical protein